MHITIKYFGQIAEVTQTNEEQLEVTSSTIAEVLNLLYDKYAGLKQKDFKIAQNQKTVPLDTLLTGAELALLPPFAGG